MNRNLLLLKGFRVAFGERIVLSGVDLQLPHHGVTLVMGPCGTGKSTLLHALCGNLLKVPDVRFSGRVEYKGKDLRQNDQRPRLVGQRAQEVLASVFDSLAPALPEREQLTRADQLRLVAEGLRLFSFRGPEELCGRQVSSLEPAEQRCLAVVRAWLSGADLLCLDEPTAELDDKAAARVIEVILRAARDRHLLVVTHNQQHAKLLGGRVALLAGGRIREVQDNRGFFERPSRRTTKLFVRSGTVAVPGPNTSIAEVDPAYLETANIEPANVLDHTQSVALRGLRWLLPNLGGMPRPGLWSDLGADLQQLRYQQVKWLITLQETPLDARALGQEGLSSEHFPIPDMNAPDPDACLRLCERIEQRLESGARVVVHCRAGLGRTGTILAAHLIFRGSSAPDAVLEARRVEHLWIQSQEQLQFLDRFAAYCRQAELERSAAPF
jgi:atypical dual specificity phosphatase